MLITINLPFTPLAKSNSYKRGKNSFYKSKNIREQEILITNAATAAVTAVKGFTPFTGPVFVSINVFYKDKRRRDIDNALKILFDCFNKIVWLDDKQVVRLVINKTIGAKSPMTQIDIISQ